MTSRRDTSSLKNTFRSKFKPEDAIGKKIRKLSGKPFQDGEKEAVVVSVGPGFDNRPAFMVQGREQLVPVIAGMCYFAADHDPAWDR